MDPSSDRRMPGRQARTGEVGIVQRLRKSLISREWGERPLVLCGYSGGADSLALLGALVALSRLGLVGVHVVHVDHGMRPESREDALLTATVAEQVGVPSTVIRISSNSWEPGSGLGVEEVLRRARYLAFADVFEETGATVLALAHHQQDQAETVLLHMLRGSGIRGASGMRTFTQIEVPWWEDAFQEDTPASIPLWRPFLTESQIEIRRFAESFHVPIVEDPSNLDLAFRRNAIRHKVLPMLEEIIPGAVANLARFSGLAGDDSDELDAQAVDALVGGETPGALDRVWLLELPIAIQRRAVRFWVQRSAAGVELSANRIEQILTIAQSRGRVREIQVGSGWSVLVSRDALSLVASDRG